MKLGLNTENHGQRYKESNQEPSTAHFASNKVISGSYEGWVIPIFGYFGVGKGTLVKVSPNSSGWCDVTQQTSWGKTIQFPIQALVGELFIAQ